MIYNDDEIVAKKKYKCMQMINGYKKISKLMQIFVINNLYKYDKVRRT